MRLTEHFTREELEFSETALRRGIDNRCPAELLDNLTYLARGLERIRLLLGNVEMHITSGYRCPALNAHIGGASGSKHTQALAADFIAPAFGAPFDICRHLETNYRTADFEQLIMEGRWVHIAFAPWPAAGKGEVLTAHFSNGKTTYSKGLA